MPPDFWLDPEVQAAFALRHMGRVIRAYRHHPHHGRRVLSQDDIARWAGIAQGQLSKVETGAPSNRLDRLIFWAQLLRIPEKHLWFKLLADEPAVALAPVYPSQPDDEIRVPTQSQSASTPFAPGATVVDREGGDETERRDALRLGLASALLSPAAVNRVLRKAAAEAAEFARRAAASSVGRGVLDHLQLVVSDLSASYSRASPEELFAVASSYRRQIDVLLTGPHTLSEARELYVYAGWLSETLAWVTHDMGSPLAADAFCVDAFEHAHQAGHNELCAWAMDARASIAMYDRRPEDALQAALRGAEKAPAGHPLAVRLHAQAARASARLGRRDDFANALRQAMDAYELLPAVAPTRFGKATEKLAAYAITAYSASSHLALGDFDEARRHAELALIEHGSATERDRSPTREAIARIDLAAALTGLGEPEEAARLGAEALSSARVVDSVLLRANDLSWMMLGRYPLLPEARDFREGLTAVQRAPKERSE